MRSLTAPVLLIATLAALVSCVAQEPLPPPQLEQEDADPVCEEGPFAGEMTDDKDADEEYRRARMAFMFGKYDFAYGIWKSLALAAHADSQTSLGWMFQTGKGVEADYKQAYEWYLKATEQNHPVAQNNLGVLYEKGWGVKRDRNLAAKWYKESAEWGYPYGQYNYGLALLNGNGVKKDRKEALYWLELSALQGIKDARNLLAEQASSAHRDSLIPESTATEDEAVTLRRAGWVRMQHPRRYTVQILRSKNEQSLLQYVFHNRLRGRLAYAATAKGVFLLLYGSFENYQDAKTALKALPQAVQDSKPFIRRFAKIHELMGPDPATSPQASGKERPARPEQNPP